MRVLIVGNASEARQNLEPLFQGGHEVVFCSDAQTAADLMQKSTFDLVISTGADYTKTGTATTAAEKPLATVTALPNRRGLNDLVEDLERRLILEAMEQTNHNQVRAADLLKITRGTLQYKLKKYNYQGLTHHNDDKEPKAA